MSIIRPANMVNAPAAAGTPKGGAVAHRFAALLEGMIMKLSRLIFLLVVWLTYSCSAATKPLCDPQTREGHLVVSPNGVWQAVTCKARPDAETAATYLRVFDPNGQNDWRLSYKDFAGNLPVDRHDVLSVFHWSINGTSAYITHPTRMDGMIGLGPGGTNLIKLDLVTGQTQVLIEDTDDVPQISFAFTIDDRFLLSVPQSFGDYKLHILDLSSGAIKIQSYSAPSLIGLGYGHWSPDNTQVILLAETDRLDYQLLVISLETGESTVVVDNLQQEFYPTDWNTDGVVSLESDTRENWTLDLETGLFIK